MEKLPENRPPWEVHLFMYPTTKAAGTMLFKLNHALGDGYSIMGALLTLFKRADNPSLPLKFPSASSRLPGLVTNYSRMSNFVYRCIYTFTDFSRGLLGTYMADDDSVLRSKTPMVEFAPVNISSVTFSLDQIRQVKSEIGATVNDVTTGVIAYALQLYMKRKGQASGETRSTALIVMNLRMLRGFKNLEDMLKANIWGNHFGFLRVSL
ncbi:wax ester/triacylglycerol synthase domain-containing protein, partial [Ralstonia pseudosolanacearum]